MPYHGPLDQTGALVECQIELRKALAEIARLRGLLVATAEAIEAHMAAPDDDELAHALAVQAASLPATP